MFIEVNEMLDILKVIENWNCISEHEKTLNINNLINDILCNNQEEILKNTEEKLKRIDIINEIAIDEIKKDKKQTNILKFEQNKKIKGKIKKVIKIINK